MNASQLLPASQVAQIFGVKTLVYGGPGTGKTPIILTAPNPVMCASEPGLLSVRHSSLPVWVADTGARIIEFVTWLRDSAEPRKYFQTVGMDSGSQMAEIFLTEAQKNNKDGRRAFMLMSQNMMWVFNTLYYIQGLHVYIICKEGNYDDSGVTKFRAFFPGQDLYVKTPHLYDEIFRVEHVRMNDGTTRPMFRTRNGFNCTARDRIGKLDEFEPTDLTHIIRKCLS
jgi:hypothetical protein